MNFEIKIVEFKFSEYDSYNFWILILSFEFPNLNFEIKITRILFFELEFWHINKPVHAENQTLSGRFWQKIDWWIRYLCII